MNAENKTEMPIVAGGAKECRWCRKDISLRAIFIRAESNTGKTFDFCSWKCVGISHGKLYVSFSRAQECLRAENLNVRSLQRKRGDK